MSTAKLPTVYFIRHGQSVYNALDELKYTMPRGSLHPCTDIRSVDAPLTLLGRKQALQARSKMNQQLQDSKQTVDLVISSPLTRAIQTAMLIFNGTDGCEHMYKYEPQNYDKHDPSIVQWLSEYVDTVQYDKEHKLLLSPQCAENLGCACDIGSPVPVLQQTFASQQHLLDTTLIPQHRHDSWWYKADQQLNTVTAPTCEPMKRFDMPSQQIKLTREPPVNLDSRIVNFMQFLKTRAERVIVVVAHYTIINRITQQHLHNCDIVKLDWSATKLKQLSLLTQPTMKNYIASQKQNIERELEKVKQEHQHDTLPLSDIADINTDMERTREDAQNDNTLDAPELPALEHDTDNQIIDLFTTEHDSPTLHTCTVTAQVKDSDQLQFIIDYINNTTTLKQYYTAVTTSDLRVQLARAEVQNIQNFQQYLVWQNITLPVRLTELQRRDVIGLAVTMQPNCNISTMLAQSILNECDQSPALIENFELQHDLVIVLARNSANIPGIDIPKLDKELEQMVALINEYVAKHPLALNNLTVVADKTANSTS